MPNNSLLRHVVMFGFKEDTTPDEVTELVRRFASLQDKVPGIEAFEWGENNSTEGLTHGLSHCFLLSFATEAARDAYLPHPDHVAFAKWTKQFVQSVTVLDYWAESKR